eukprot:gene19217-24309_t
MPHYAFVFLLFTMANVGLPGTSGFIGEITSLAGAYKWGTWVAFVATSGVILSAVYALNLYKRVMFGEVVNEELKKYPDLSVREIAIFTPLILGTLLLGIYPAYVFDITTASGHRRIRTRLMDYNLALNLALPEAIIAVASLLILVFGAFRGDKGMTSISALCGVALLVAAYFAAFDPQGSVFSGSFIVDGVSQFAKV